MLQYSELEVHESWVALRVHEDRPQDLHILVLAGLDILVQDMHSLPCQPEITSHT